MWEDLLVAPEHDVPDTRYARGLDGTAIAYQVVGDGPVDVLWRMGRVGIWK
jgi:hypothetical protein